MNSSFVLFPFLLVALLSSACEPTKTPETTSSAGPTTPTPTATPKRSSSHPQSPLLLYVDGPSQVLPGETITVQLRLEVHQPNEAIELMLDLPPGVSLKQGDLQEKILPGMGPFVERRFLLHVNAVPSEDLVVRATQQGSSWGVHAQKNYRFGRPEPTLSWGERSAKPLPGIPGNPIPISP